MSEKVTINSLVESYPGIFMIIDDELFFCDDLRIIFDEPLLLIDSGLYIQIVPNENFKETHYWFCIEISYDDDPDYDKVLALHRDGSFVLPDELCVRFYDYGFDVDGYDRAVIERRHAIKNIINGYYFYIVGEILSGSCKGIGWQVLSCQ